MDLVGDLFMAHCPTKMPVFVCLLFGFCYQTRKFWHFSSKHKSDNVFQLCSQVEEQTVFACFLIFI